MSVSSGHRATGTLSLILLTYVKPLDAIDAEMKRHVAFLEKGFDDGLFLIAGRKHPREGGVILCRGDAAAARDAADADPFVTAGVATAEVIEFNASFAADAIAALIA